MNEAGNVINPVLWRRHKLAILGVSGSLLAAFLWPFQFADTVAFVLMGMLEVSPLVILGILISAWVNASGAGGRIRQAFEGNQLRAILAASAIGAITPVCGVTVLPLMAGLLSSGVPLAPVMAFWLSSPVTDPAMFSVTAATLGFQFAIAKTVAALLLGLFGGMITTAISSRSWILSPLREKGLAATLGKQVHCSSAHIEYAIWDDAERIKQFNAELWAMTKLIVICLGLAFAAEYQMQAHLEPQALADYLGQQSVWAVPLAVIVGSPAYLDGYAALPLTRGLIDHGMSPGAAMAFLVSGSVVSIWGAIAIFPVLRIKPFALYLLLAAIGSLAVGWLYDWIT
ncbi:MAG: permease [Gammaproteobacteria bacterium]|nr:MAG: permease [Gammaproteobacteria bacterium]